MKLVLFDLGEVLVTLSDSAKAELDSIVGGNHQEAFYKPWFEFMKFHDRYLSVKDELSEKIYWHDFFSGMKRFKADEVRRLVHVYMDPASWLPNAEAFELINNLRNSGMGMGIISNAFPSMLKVVARYDMIGYFDPLLLSFLVGRMKPDVGIFRIAMGKHKAEDCMFIDDNLSFASTASMLGMHGVWLNITGERKELPLGVTEIKSLTDLSNDSRLFQEGVL